MKKNAVKILLTILVLIIFAGAMLILNHTVKNGTKTENIVPPIADTPVYVECKDGETLEVSILPRETFALNGFQMILVNLSEESSGTVRFTLKDGRQDILMDQVMAADSIPVGEWFGISAETELLAGEQYTFLVTAQGCEPYFIKSPLEEINRALPFVESVRNAGQEVAAGISLGIAVSSQAALTFGEIFYFSVPLCIIAAVLAVLTIWFGYGRLLAFIKKIPFGRFFGRFGNELFLLLLFAAVCISIYYRAVVQGIYITSDSAGYLREAVNLANGNGFSYDGMAGYDSWFANWPVLYPALIAAVMLITGQGAYLASKILSMILVGIILLIIRLCFKKDAWVYALSLTNIGFLSLAYYTWSELPFMLFMLCFGIALTKILQEDTPSVKWYVLLGIAGLCCFLTRYYGIYVWFVAGFYLLLLLVRCRKEKNKQLLKNAAALTVTAFLSGCLSLLYMFVNKLMNGMASGVSRSMWWDDYESLTNDLIESLLTELFNAFSLQIPQMIEGFPYSMKALLLIVVLTGFVWFIYKNCRHFTKESVFIAMAVIYYGMFICIRYFSSMDTFYFRFFEPATFLFSIGIIGLILPYVRGKQGFHYFAGAVTMLILTAVISVFESGGIKSGAAYYETITRQWDSAYKEIPEKSVIIFNDIDFRSTWYRPDVVDGTITPEDTYESIQAAYYGSDYLCIRTEFAEIMLDEGDYDESIRKMLQDGLQAAGQEKEFLVIAMK